MLCCATAKIMVPLEKLALKLNLIEHFPLIGFTKPRHTHICIVDRHLFSLFTLSLDY